VGSCDAKFPIRLEGLAYAHGHFSSVRIECLNHLFTQLKINLVFGMVFLSNGNLFSIVYLKLLGCYLTWPLTSYTVSMSVPGCASCS
jgi:hypothetical protein